MAAIMEQFKVAKWGNSLAVRLPKRWTKRLDIHEGDTIPAELLFGSAAIRARLEAEREASRMSREEAIAAMRQAREEFPQHLKPEDWKVDHNDPEMRG